MPPEYDFEAADRFRQQLSQFVAKIDWFTGVRDGQRKVLLGSPHSDNWQGAKRTSFEGKFSHQQAALRELKDVARRLQAQAAKATEAAHAAHKSGH